MKYHRRSLHPFGSGQILNPYAAPLQCAVRFLSCSHTLYAVSSSYEVDTLKNKEHIGLTTFHIVNNCECLRSYHWTGRNIVHLLRNAYRFRNHLRTFWFKCNSLISLVTYNDPEIVHFTFSITLLS